MGGGGEYLLPHLKRNSVCKERDICDRNTIKKTY